MGEGRDALSTHEVNLRELYRPMSTETHDPDDHIKEIVRAEVNKLFIKLMLSLGLPLLATIGGLAGTLALVNKHMSDGHPSTVHARVSEQKERLAELKAEIQVWRNCGLPLVLVELRADVGHIKADVADLKKKWGLSVDSP